MSRQHAPLHNIHKERYLTIRRVTWIGVIANILLSVVKLVFGWLGHSQALIADGLHSLADLISDGVVLIAAKYSAQDADAEHPYGHARFETLATVIIGTLLLLLAVGMFLDAGHRLLQPTLLLQPEIITLVVAVISILLKEVLYYYTLWAAERVHSQLLRAHAWHHRSDSISTVIVLIGVIGTMAGAQWLDAMAALMVSGMIAHIGWSLGWGGIRELVDTGLSDDKLAMIKQIINSVDGVQNIHGLRTRYTGAQVFVDVHILVNPRISVSEGHQISETVRHRLIDDMQEILDVVVHIDPENDETEFPNLKLPSRQEIIARLQPHWETLGISHSIDQVTLHYLAGQLTIDIYLPLQVAQDIAAAQAVSYYFAELATKEVDISRITVYYH